jgi:hypothetical protein
MSCRLRYMLLTDLLVAHLTISSPPWHGTSWPTCAPDLPHGWSLLLPVACGWRSQFCRSRTAPLLPFRRPFRWPQTLAFHWAAG